MSEHPAATPDDGADEAAAPASDDRSGSAAARGAWVASGLAFFVTGVAFTVTMPDNFAMGITFLALGVVFFSLAGTQRAPGDGPAAVPDAPPPPRD